MSASMYYNIIVVLLTVYLNYIQGQIYSIQGLASYGIRGADYRFTCQISGDNIPQGVEFSRDASQICSLLLIGGRCESSPTSTRYTCGCINGNNRALYLNITDVQSTDGRDWTCSDFDVNGGSSPPSTLLVYYGPDNVSFTPTSSSITVIENESRSVTCSADCNPPCNINWYKGSTIMSSTGLLSLNNTKRQQAGNYTCQTQHKNITNNILSKVLQLIVHYKPILDPNKDTKTSISVSRGETGVLSIHVLAYPLPVYTWYYQQQDGSERLVIDFRSNQADDGLSSTLTIQDVTVDEGRKYIVYVNNSLGTRSIVFNLAVLSNDENIDRLGNKYEASTERVVGIAIGFGISLLIFAIIAVLLWFILKRTGRRFCIKRITVNNETEINDTNSIPIGLENITLPETPPIYDRVDTDAVDTTDPSNTDYINSETTRSPYEVLDKQTVDQQPNSYQQLDTPSRSTRLPYEVLDKQTVDQQPNSYQQLDTPSRSTYEVLDKQTTDQQPNTYEQLSPYQNVT